MNAAFDVGADDGLHGILFAFANPKIKVFAFEPIKGSKKRIIKNLKKIEKFFQIKISNYEIFLDQSLKKFIENEKLTEIGTRKLSKQN